MIQLAEDIEAYDARKVPIDPAWRRLLIEVASDGKIDIAVVDANTAKKFDASETGTDIAIDCVIANARQHDFEWERTSAGGGRYFLLFWNSNEDSTAIVAYRFTSLPKRGVELTV